MGYFKTLLFSITILGVFLPFISALTIGFFGRFLGYKGTVLLTTLTMGITALLNIYTCYITCYTGEVYLLNLGNFIKVGLLVVNWLFLFDPLSGLMGMTVAVISLSVHLFSFVYMRDDPHFIRFIAYLTGFTFFMLLLVASGNLIIFFWGWEGIGLCSYLLINFWFTRVQANKAAIKALLYNKVGDLTLLFAVIALFHLTKTTDFYGLFSHLNLIKFQPHWWLVNDVADVFCPYNIGEDFPDEFNWGDSIPPQRTWTNWYAQNLEMGDDFDYLSGFVVHQQPMNREVFSGAFTKSVDLAIQPFIEEESGVTRGMRRLMGDIGSSLRWNREPWHVDFYKDVVGVDTSLATDQPACVLHFYSSPLFYAIFICIFIAVMSKSAQLGLHAWLTDAIEGPTPVSALIHAATLVTAGIYLFLRLTPVLDLYGPYFSIVLIVGSLTAFYSALSACVQFDIKKIIAFSTCSQLGYMVAALGLKTYELSLFHLVGHAYFKSLLFLAAGMVIHALADEQDVRKMGALRTLLPLSYIFFLVGNLSAMGFPFLTGFYTKEPIIEMAYLQTQIPYIFESFMQIEDGSFYWDTLHWLVSVFAFGLLMSTVLLTVIYSWRLMYWVFFGSSNVSRIALVRLRRESVFYVFPLSVLMFGSIFLGYFWKALIIGVGSNVFSSVFPNDDHFLLLYLHFVPASIKLLPVLLLVIGVIGTHYTYAYRLNFLIYLQLRYVGYYNLIINNFNFNALTNRLSSMVFDFSSTVFFNLEKGLLEQAGPLRVDWAFNKVETNLESLQTKTYYDYFITVLFAVVSLVAFFVCFGSWILQPVRTLSEVHSHNKACLADEIKDLRANLDKATLEQLWDPNDEESLQSSKYALPRHNFYRLTSDLPAYEHEDDARSTAEQMGEELAVYPNNPYTLPKTYVSPLWSHSVDTTTEIAQAAWFIGAKTGSFNLGAVFNVLIVFLVSVSVYTAILCFWRSYSTLLINLAFFLLTLLPNILILYWFGLEFMALVFALVYAGAIVIMFTFVIITLDPQQAGKLPKTVPDVDLALIVLLVGLSLVGLRYVVGTHFAVLLRESRRFYENQLYMHNEAAQKFNLSRSDDLVFAYGEYMFYILGTILCIISFMLFVAMIGAILITFVSRENADPEAETHGSDSDNDGPEQPEENSETKANQRVVTGSSDSNKEESGPVDGEGPEQPEENSETKANQRVVTGSSGSNNEESGLVYEEGPEQPEEKTEKKVNYYEAIPRSDNEEPGQEGEVVKPLEDTPQEKKVN